ncbi:hypothetical protein HZH68_005815 [Vespula germanica]|uniref:Uncharacterized protein n=1 Tax=Vespula germanica TaxID=30212 RepID=A0A834KGR2_VESGE|nr:hypothetical protein HZH68_005815 [Vespula germanica]
MPERGFPRPSCKVAATDGVGRMDCQTTATPPSPSPLSPLPPSPPLTLPLPPTTATITEEFGPSEEESDHRLLNFYRDWD